MANTTYKKISRQHSEYLGDYWRQIDALYAGGRKLLGDVSMLEAMLPKWADETNDSYRGRKALARYENVVSTIINHIASSLGADPITVEQESGKLEENLEAFVKMATPPGCEKPMSLAEFAIEQMRRALKHGIAWTLIDLPRAIPVANEAEQVEAGLLTPFALAVDAKSVINWSYGDDGGLDWVVIKECIERMASPLDSAGDKSIERFTLLTRTGWLRYEVDEEKKNSGDMDMGPVEEGFHSFGVVPMVRMKLDDSLWVGDILFSQAREYFNATNALDEAKRKTAYQQLYEFLAPAIGGIDTAINEHQEDAGRAKNQPRGPGLTQVRGHEDDARYVGPDSSSLSFQAEDNKHNRESMYRITLQMALSEDNRGSLIKRSAESKAIDHDATNVLLCALGRVARSHVCAIVKLAQRGSASELAGIVVGGAAKFDATSVSDLLERAYVVSSLPIPSPTFLRDFWFEFMKALSEGRLTPETLDKIWKECEVGVTQEQVSDRTSPGPSINAIRRRMGTARGAES